MKLDVTLAGSSALAQLSVDLEPTDEPERIELPFVIENGEVSDTPLEFRALLSEGGRIGLARLEVAPIGTVRREEIPW